MSQTILKVNSTIWFKTGDIIIIDGKEKLQVTEIEDHETLILGKPNYLPQKILAIALLVMLALAYRWVF